MNRRPWPIVLLAILQFISPIIYLGVASIFYGISFGDTAREVLSLSSDLRKFELFVLPVLLGGLILFTRRVGYMIVIIGSVYLIVRSVLEFLATNQTDPLFPVVISNVICALVLIYFLRAKTREVYFNPRIRWWETDPRYVVEMSGKITRVGTAGANATIVNIANGGAGVRTGESHFLPEEIVELIIGDGASKIVRKARIIWQRPEGNGTFLGLQWADSGGEEHSKLRRLVRDLKAKKTPTTRKVVPWWEDLKNWLTGKKA